MSIKKLGVCAWGCVKQKLANFVYSFANRPVLKRVHANRPLVLHASFDIPSADVI